MNFWWKSRLLRPIKRLAEESGYEQEDDIKA